MWGVLLALLAASWKGADMRPLELIRSGGNIAEYVHGFFPPQAADWRSDLSELLVTVEIALWGTALSAVLGVPFAMRPLKSSVPSSSR